MRVHSERHLEELEPNKCKTKNNNANSPYAHSQLNLRHCPVWPFRWAPSWKLSLSWCLIHRTHKTINNGIKIKRAFKNTSYIRFRLSVAVYTIITTPANGTNAKALQREGQTRLQLQAFRRAGQVESNPLLHSDSRKWKWMEWSLGRRLSFNRGSHPLPWDMFVGVYMCVCFCVYHFTTKQMLASIQCPI